MLENFGLYLHYKIKQKIIKIMENNNHYYQSSSIEQLKIWWTQEVQQQQQQQRKIHSFVNHQWGMNHITILYADDDVGQLSTLLAKKKNVQNIFNEMRRRARERERERVKTN